MSLKIEKGKFYTMPVFFGPASTFNQPAHDGKPAKNMASYYQPGVVNVLQVTYETEREILEDMIPECYTLNDPYVSVNVCEFTNLGWLAGKTYNLINVNVPVHFKGERDDLDGDLVLVMFENHTDPIIGGRETMGYSKMFCNIPRVEHNENKYVARALCFDFCFMKMELDTSKPIPDKETFIANGARSKGKVHYKYCPDVMEKGDDPRTNYRKPALAYPTILPNWVKPDDYPYPIRTPEVTYCDGTVEFYQPTWEDWPTYYNVGTGLHSLKCKRVIGAKQLVYDEPCCYSTCYKLR